MSRRFVMRVLTTPTDLMIACRHLETTVERLRARNRALAADLAVAGRVQGDLEGANAALITEVNALRRALGGQETRRAALADQAALGRALNATQARIIADQGRELVRATEALGVVLHADPADTAWARGVIETIIQGGADR